MGPVDTIATPSFSLNDSIDQLTPEQQMQLLEPTILSSIQNVVSELKRRLDEAKQD
jgi:hypothetical protein